MKQAVRGGNALLFQRHLNRGGRFIAMLGVASLLVTGTILGQSTVASAATDYPSWSDVQAARNNVKAKEAEIKRLDGLLASLQAAVTTAQEFAKQKGAEYQAAQQDYDEAEFRAGQLQARADEERAKADKSQQRAGQLAAQLARTGGGDLSSTIFFSGDGADDLLAQLGLASMVKDQAASLYAKAIQDQNSAQAQTDQANRAKDALKDLATAAQEALEEATAASEKAAAAVDEQQGNKTRLEAQRASLVGTQAVTEKSYNQGVAVAAAKKAAAEKAAREWAAAHPAPPSSGGGAPSSSGWVRPAGGHISSPYGWRINPVTGRYALHAGTDLAAGCNSPIYAASGGTVSYSGWNGGYGNFVLINHGGGLSTGYGHIVNGGILVHVGQHVNAGQQIARVGSTGQSTGCHLHFETRPGGVAVDAVPFMRARGVTLG